MSVLLKLICIFEFAVIGNYLFLSCPEKEKCGSSILEVALKQIAANRLELEKVLARYKMFPDDSLRYNSSCFFSENMAYYTYYKRKQLDKYLTYYVLLHETIGLGISPNQYKPRNYDDNYIRPGDNYELFCCTGKNNWKSIGNQISSGDSLAYKDVPTNGLFLLKNYSRGVQERIFVYEGRRQVWK